MTMTRSRLDRESAKCSACPRQTVTRRNEALVHDSIVGSTFRCRVVESVTADGHPAVIPQIPGMAYRCGPSEFTLDPHDPLRAQVRAAMSAIHLPLFVVAESAMLVPMPRRHQFSGG